eukprot:COSAG01_NODE_5335_length_4326_cov_9.032174_5_plen_141_part_00
MLRDSLKFTFLLMESMMQLQLLVARLLVFGAITSASPTGAAVLDFNYRIGDTVNGFAAGFQPETTHAARWGKYRQTMNRDYPGSIAAAYLNRTDRAYNYDVLCEIARERGREAGCRDLPPPATAVVHLRLGGRARCAPSC